MRLLLVEDDPTLGDGLASGLRALGFTVDWMRTGADADGSLASVAYDAVILDLGLPDEDGLAWLRRWRDRGDTCPVLILTARDAVESRVGGLDTGADDYLVKPVALAELAARLRALMRRARGTAEPVWRHGALEFDPGTRAVRYRGQRIELTAREAGVLEVLLLNPGRVLSKSQIEEKLFGWDEDVDSNALEVWIHRLRRKIAQGVVRTVRGVGYVIGPAEELT
ncbi:MAG TPA: response regulator [Burkholderiaceae bacterium]|nr:response regulator [Burkholderiaceae bacterium]